MPNEQVEFTVFENSGFKINHTTFELVPLSDEYAGDEPVFLQDIPSWDLYEMLEMMTKEELEKFHELRQKCLQQKGGK